MEMTPFLQPIRLKIISQSVVIFFFVILTGGAAVACPACKDAVAGQGAAVTRGYARSIHLLMAMPYALFAGLAFTIARSARRNKK